MFSQYGKRCTCVTQTHKLMYYTSVLYRSQWCLYGPQQKAEVTLNRVCVLCDAGRGGRFNVLLNMKVLPA